VIEFPNGLGSCRITAEPDCLLLTLVATDPADLARMEQIIGGDIERFAARENLNVRWQPN
jgi:hypothetical protein